MPAFPLMLRSNARLERTTSECGPSVTGGLAFSHLLCCRYRKSYTYLLTGAVWSAMITFSSRENAP